MVTGMAIGKATGLAIGTGIGLGVGTGIGIDPTPPSGAFPLEIAGPPLRAARAALFLERYQP